MVSAFAGAGLARGPATAMAEQNSQVVCVGEVLIEFVRGGDGRFGVASGGDVFNTAIYLARAGARPALATAVGDDPYSDALVALAAVEGVAGNLMLRVGGRLPGLAAIDTAPDGKRRQYFWRDTAPARDLFELPNWGQVADALLKTKLVYFTGITLSLYSNSAIGRFLAVLEMARQQGVKVAFDGNFRPRGWGGDVTRSRAVFIEALKRVDIALPAYDDEAVLWGDPSPEATVDRLQAFGIAEVVVKNGPNSALVAANGRREFVPVPEVVVPVDTTAAGDGFNAGYLAARLGGKAPSEAAADAHRLAGQVIRHPGALMPRAAAAVH
jgi:2-dehydro-3-deoxygluconokinase